MSNSSREGKHGLSDAEKAEVASAFGYRQNAAGHWVPANGSSSVTDKQWHRWSYVTLEGQLQLPPASLQLWEVAIRVGKIMRRDKSFDRIKSQEDVLCVEVRPQQRDLVLSLVDRQERWWRTCVTAWEAVRMAHRCPDAPRGAVRLFLAPEARCPVCSEDLSAALGGPEKRHPEDRIAAPTVPRSVPDPGMSSRSEKGSVSSGDVENSLVGSALESEEGSEKSRAIALIEEGLGPVEVVEEAT